MTLMPSITKPSAKKAPRRAPAPGPGKQKKVFPEEGGVSQLLQLSNAITDAKSDVLDRRVEHNKLKIQAHQQKKEQEKQKQKEKLTTQKAESRAKSKAEIKAALKAQKREKAKARKEARKLRALENGDDQVKSSAINQTASSPSEEPDSTDAPIKKKLEKKPRKSVTFSLP